MSARSKTQVPSANPALEELHKAQGAAWEALNYLAGASGDIVDAWSLKDGGVLLEALGSIKAAQDHLKKIYPGSLEKFERFAP